MLIWSRCSETRISWGCGKTVTPASSPPVSSKHPHRAPASELSLARSPRCPPSRCGWHAREAEHKPASKAGEGIVTIPDGKHLPDLSLTAGCCSMWLSTAQPSQEVSSVVCLSPFLGAALGAPRCPAGCSLTRRKPNEGLGSRGRDVHPGCSSQSLLCKCSPWLHYDGSAALTSSPEQTEIPQRGKEEEEEEDRTALVLFPSKERASAPRALPIHCAKMSLQKGDKFLLSKTTWRCSDSGFPSGPEARGRLFWGAPEWSRDGSQQGILGKEWSLSGLEGKHTPAPSYFSSLNFSKQPTN